MEEVSPVVSIATCVDSLWVPKESILLSWHGALSMKLGAWWPVLLSILQRGGAVSDSWQELYPSAIRGSWGTNGIAGEVVVGLVVKGNGWGDCGSISREGLVLVMVFRTGFGMGKADVSIAWSITAEVGGTVTPTMPLPLSSVADGITLVMLEKGSIGVAKGGVGVVLPRSTGL